MNGWRCTWKLTLKGYPTLKSDAKGILTNRQCVDELGVGTCCPVRDCWYPSKWNHSLKAFIVLLSVVNTKSESLREFSNPASTHLANPCIKWIELYDCLLQTFTKIVGSRVCLLSKHFLQVTILLILFQRMFFLVMLGPLQLVFVGCFNGQSRAV